MGPAPIGNGRHRTRIAEAKGLDSKGQPKMSHKVGHAIGYNEVTFLLKTEMSLPLNWIENKFDNSLDRLTSTFHIN